jgi:hypothetical protein
VRCASMWAAAACDRLRGCSSDSLGVCMRACACRCACSPCAASSPGRLHAELGSRGCCGLEATGQQCRAGGE